MVRNRTLRSRLRVSVLAAAVIVAAGGCAALTPASAQEAVCGAKLTDWLDAAGSTTYVGSIGTGKKEHTSYTSVFTGKVVTTTSANSVDPHVKDAPYQFPPGPRMEWEYQPRKGHSEGSVQFELKHPVCAAGETLVRSAVATVADQDRDSDPAAGPRYCASAYRVGKGSPNPPAPSPGVCAPGEL